MNVKTPKDLVNKFKIMMDFNERIDSIKNEDVRNFVNDALADAPEEFWKAKSSSSGNNHPPENNLDYGLLVHIIKAMEVAEELFRFYGIEEGSIEEDIVRASILLHDIYKQGKPWQAKHCKPHGRLCANILKQYDLDEHIKARICRCIDTHMSRWAEPADSIQAFIMPDNLQVIVALSDYIASRNGISFYPDMSILGEDNE